MPISTSPNPGDIHINTPLTNFSQKYLLDQNMFIAGRAFPLASVMKQSDLYYVFNREDFFRDEAEERANGTQSAGGGFTVSNDSYFTRRYDFHKDITETDRANADSQIQLEQSSAQYVTHKMLIKRERLFAASYFDNPAVWTSTANTDWTGVADPVDDVMDAKTVVQGLTGYRPNKGIATRSAWDTLMKNDALLARISGGSNNNIPAQMKMELIMGWFELDQILILDGIYNTALEGSPMSNAFIGGDNFLLYYAPNAVGLNEPTAGVHFAWTGLLGNTPNGIRIKRIDAPLEEATRIEGSIAVDYKLTGPDLGYMFTTPSTT